jgi:hypothetical protein
MQCTVNKIIIQDSDVNWEKYIFKMIRKKGNMRENRRRKKEEKEVPGKKIQMGKKCKKAL